MKICVKCNINKEDNDFYIKTEKSGNKRLCSWCKQCSKNAAIISRKKLRMENPDLLKIKERNWYNSNKVKYNKNKNIRAKQLKIKCVEYKGGKCVSCGYDKYLAALDFHHVDNKSKDFMITQKTNFEQIKGELDKCILLCSNCHRAVHSKELELKIQLDAVV